MVRAHKRKAVSSEIATDDRRRHDRIAGPFDAWRVGILETPLRIYDLSLGGCFVNAMHDQELGVAFTIKVHLPFEGWLTLKAETLYRRPGFGYAVRFADLSPDTEQRLERAIQQLQHGITIEGEVRPDA
jgi:hypothetical protein